jgi:AraC family transcriptional regulator
MRSRDGVRLPGMVLRRSWYLPGAIQREHQHYAGSLTLVLRGELVEQARHREETARPLSVVVKPPGTRHANRFGPQGACLLQLQFDPDAAGPAPDWCWGEWRWVHGGEIARRFVSVLAAGEASVDGELESRILELIAEVSAAREAERGVPGGSSPPESAPGWLRDARARLALEFATPVRVSELARDAGVHPVSFARAFRRHYGVPATVFARNRRVAAAAEELSQREHDLADIAYLTGFADQAHFCRVFKRATGLTPTRYRALAAS